MAMAVCMILGTWAVVYARADTDKNDTTAAQTITTGVTTVATGTAIFQKGDLFSDRDLQQVADLSKAVTYTVSDSEDITITAAGVYVLTGSARDVTVYVEASKEDKVQLVLDGLTLTNGDSPAIYVKSADKVFVTTSADSSLSVTGSFQADGDTKLDGVIFSKSDLTLNGTAALTISSTKNGVVGKDDLKITGGTYTISAKSKAIEANDSIRVADGALNLTAGTDGLHAENDDDTSKGYVYIGGGAISINAGDDGINAAQKSASYRATVEINGGDITVVMGAGDTDGVDSNGDIIVNGGTIDLTGNNTFDYDGSAQYNGGTIIANGQQIDYIPNQMMGGMGGGFGGGWGGNDGWGNPGGNTGGWGGFGGRGGH